MRWTAHKVSWTTEHVKSRESFWPNIPAQLVHYRTRLYLDAFSHDGENTTPEVFARVELPPRHARLLPDARLERAAERDIATLAAVVSRTGARPAPAGGGVVGKRDSSVREPVTPSSSQPLEKKAAVRSDADPRVNNRVARWLGDTLRALGNETRAAGAAGEDAARSAAADADALPCSGARCTANHMMMARE